MGKSPESVEGKVCLVQWHGKTVMADVLVRKEPKWRKRGNQTVLAKTRMKGLDRFLRVHVRKVDPV